jgi:ATP-binding cassette subfamily B (MDR/TAP) protein 1
LEVTVESRLEESERGEEEKKKNSCRRQRRGIIGIDSYAKRATRAAAVTVMADHPIPDIVLPVPTGAEMLTVSSAENASEAEAKEWEQKHEEGGEGKKKKKKKKLLGKKKGEEEAYTVPFFKLFSYADSFDLLLMVVGTVGAIANGLAMPLMTIVFGSLTNAFGNNQSDNSVLVHAVSKVALKFVYIGIGAAVASYCEVTCWMITGERQAARIRTLYLKAILRQDVPFFDQETTTGAVVGRMAGDTILIQDAIGEKV